MKITTQHALPTGRYKRKRHCPYEENNHKRRKKLLQQKKAQPAEKYQHKSNARREIPTQ